MESPMYGGPRAMQVALAGGPTYMADSDGDSDEARVLGPLLAAACTYRIAFGPLAGQKVLAGAGRHAVAGLLAAPVRRH
jgi:hypothetical protein